MESRLGLEGGLRSRPKEEGLGSRQAMNRGSFSLGIEGALGLGAWSFQANGASSCAGEGESAFLSLSDSFLSRGYASPPWGGDVILTSNKDHSECGCAVGVISALEGQWKSFSPFSPAENPLGSPHPPPHLIFEIF